MLTKDEMLTLYRKLLLARQSEERIRQEYFKDEMKTPVHLGVGGEAIPVGVCHCLLPGTKTFGTYRNHAQYLALTEDTDGFFMELYGKMMGSSKGKAGSMHLSAPELGMVATSAVVGTTIPVAVGAALANAYRRSTDLVVTFFGDGALEEGVFWESMNFASLRRLRVLFICEDNDLAIHSPRSDRHGFRSIEEVLRGFHCYVGGGDGCDMEQVIVQTRRVLDLMAIEPKPSFLRFRYFRFLEHVGPREDFDAGYRGRPTPEETKTLDPVHRFEGQLLARGITTDELETIKQKVCAQIDRSVLAAQQAPFPASTELYTDVFA